VPQGNDIFIEEGTMLIRAPLACLGATLLPSSHIAATKYNLHPLWHCPPDRLYFALATNAKPPTPRETPL
jgi:hypothetical protein